MQNPFHEGELQVQKLAGEESIAERNSGAIGDRIPGGARPFLTQQSMAVFASRDSQKRLWASILFGSRGFLRAVDGLSVDVNLAQVALQPRDPFWQNIEADATVGMLAIELSSRRRIRINGEISRTDNALHLSVKEAFPNCPKYITRRKLTTTGVSAPTTDSSVSGGILAPEQERLIQRADVLFLATAHPTRGADASHRGGNRGFIQVDDAQTLRIPDYSGNGMFNSFGNVAVNPSVGLVIPDFESGRILQLTGRAEILFDAADPENETGGTHRFLVFHVDEWLQTSLPAGITTELLDYSPYNPR